MRAAILLATLTLPVFATPGATHDLQVTLEPDAHRMRVEATLTLAPIETPRKDLQFALTDYAEKLRVDAPGKPRLERKP